MAAHLQCDSTWRCGVPSVLQYQHVVVYRTKSWRRPFTSSSFCGGIGVYHTIYQYHTIPYHTIPIPHWAPCHQAKGALSHTLLPFGTTSSRLPASFLGF
eukprot:scaffold9313_cov140-Amphora_coffeaeformis.AAC.1